MNMFNKLPYFVVLRNIKYKINVDFRKMISLEKKLEDKSIDDTEKIMYALRNFYPFFYELENYKQLLTDQELFKEACSKILWFYKCGRENYHKSASTSSSNKKKYSYDYDDEYIWGAFYYLFNIDLTKDKVHWWKFKAIMNSLPENTEFVKIIRYRSYSGKDKDLLELKQYWELPQAPEEQERLNRLYELLK
ncbi:MAG: hypothetical protein J6K45_06535 [Clostridia bacterium]|nr:hypothetical protein [Clostridia bacterium]